MTAISATRPYPGQSVGDGDRCGRTREGLELLLIDDRLESRHSIVTLLRSRPGIGAIRCAESTGAALSLARRHHPGVCLVSTLDRGNVPALIHELKQLPDPARVLMLADQIDARAVAGAILAEADGILWRYADCQQTAWAIRRVSAGHQHFPALPKADLHATLNGLIDHDRAMAAMLLRRVPRDDVARTLGVSASALERQRKRVLRRLADAPEATLCLT